MDLKKDVVKTYELPKGAKIKTTTTRDGVEQEEILTYNGMDGMYGKFIADDGVIFNAAGKLEKKGGFYFFK